MSYCQCGGYLGSGGVDGYAGRWCRCANPKLLDAPAMTSNSFTLIVPTYQDYYEPSEEQKELEDLRLRIKEIADNMEGVPKEFEETFKKKFKDILA